MHAVTQQQEPEQPQHPRQSLQRELGKKGESPGDKARVLLAERGGESLKTFLC